MSTKTQTKLHGVELETYSQQKCKSLHLENTTPISKHGAGPQQLGEGFGVNYTVLVRVIKGLYVVSNAPSLFSSTGLKDTAIWGCKA